MNKPRLMTPGPAMVPEDVLLELARPVIHHRSAEAKQVIVEVVDGPEGSLPDAERRPDPDGLRAPGRWRPPRSTPCRPGGKALVLNAGYFAARWANICKAYGINAVIARDRVGPARRPRPGRRGPAAAPRHRLRDGHPERDLDRHRPPGRGDRPGRRRDRRRLRRRRHLGRRRDGVPDRRVGRRPALRRLAEGPDAAAGPGVRRGQPQGLGEDRRLRLAQLLLQPQGRPQEDRRSSTRRTPRRTR